MNELPAACAILHRVKVSGARGCGEHTMSDAAKTGSAKTEWMRRLAAARGLGRAFAMYPETVTAAFARASQCMCTLPANMSPVTEPMPRFDPAAARCTEASRLIRAPRLGPLSGFGISEPPSSTRLWATSRGTLGRLTLSRARRNEPPFPRRDPLRRLAGSAGRAIFLLRAASANRAYEAGRPSGSEQLFRIGADARRTGNRELDVEAAIVTTGEAVFPASDGS
jgi:hypothetical protein